MTFPGQAFQNVDPRHRDNHLHIVLSAPNPDGLVAVANLTTWAPHKDQACIVHAGEHPFVRHESCVAYERAALRPAAGIDKLLALGLAAEWPPVTGALLSRMQRGIHASPNAANELRAALPPT